MADVFQFEIDETHPEANFDPDDNDDRNDVSEHFPFLTSFFPSSPQGN